MKLILSDRPLNIPIQDRDKIHYIDLSSLKIANCTGCFSCWTKTPGRCIIRDDATQVYPRIAESDTVLYVSRLKYGSYDTVMKTMLERAIPIQQAFIRIHHGETHHVQRAVASKKATIIAYGAEMGKILILNGSPRAPKSNSKRYAEIFTRHCPDETVYQNITKRNHQELCAAMEGYTDVLFVFPLYADSLPVGLLNFLKTLEANPPASKPVISILINCGFLEYEQNEVAIRIMHFFCRRNGFTIGSVLMLGSGEAILETPFKYIAQRNIKRLAHSITNKDYRILHATMPLPKSLFRLAAQSYWTRYGKKFGTTKEQMQTMEIEGK